MSDVGQLERKTQDRVVKLFIKRLRYKYLGNWSDRQANSHIEEQILRQNLLARGYHEDLVTKAIHTLQRAASVGGPRSLYEANREVYSLLRYGVPVRLGAGEHFRTVWPIDWSNLASNDFYIAEEVTIRGEHNKRPDIVIYVNGLALGVVELKRSTVTVSDGIRQNIGNQQQNFIRSFFSTVQILFAANDVEGLRYGVIETPERYWLEWKEPSELLGPLDRGLIQMCSKERFLELIRDFMVYDCGVKKTARHSQYFGVKAAQKRILRREGGIIWHTQGSGKSLTMVWLAKWIRENQDSARVLIITDRTELDDQIEMVFRGVNENIHRSQSGADLIGKLNKYDPWLICTLVHKFRGSDDDKNRDESSQAFLAELKSKIPANFRAKGNLFVFVDEAHRTQSGKMHDAMKELLPGAMFIGFTGTPLLKTDKETTTERFGPVIHSYRFDEAVADRVVLDLRYEARNIDQDLTSPKKVDQWFEAKTAGMTDLTKAELKKRWGTMQKVVSSEPRARQIVQDILLDMETRPRLMDFRGNAMLVSGSIYQACKFYEMFVNAGFEDKVAIVTSYVPNASDVAKENSGTGKSEKVRQYEIYRQMLARFFNEPADAAVLRIDEFEKEVKRRFVEEPGQMRLLIVVDKLLTGFDAPSATYLYIDKKMRDHGLFQAICRVNRLDTDDKEYGYIVDYQDLFKSLEDAVSDYTSMALEGFERDDVEGLLKDRIAQERDDLDKALELIRALCEPVRSPRETLQFQQYFCAETAGNMEQLKANERKRVELYKAVSSLVRAYSTLANDMTRAGYTSDEARAIKAEIAHWVNVRDEVKLGAGENVDFKQYEAGMRSLLDTYIRAEPSETVATFDNMGLVGLIQARGAAALDELPAGVRRNEDAVAETILNNVRRTIVDERALNPKFFDSMSTLLDALIEQRKQEAIDYASFLQSLLDLTERVGKRSTGRKYPTWVNSEAQQALFDLGWDDDATPKLIYETIQREKRDSWVGSRFKEKEVANAVRAALPAGFDEGKFLELFSLIKQHDEYR
ncbi:type I restriction endonuclease subunit R [Arthrobacter sp. MPF02]|uniref:type I restriction endonuclease subunit R n=1 Tax=Arthrobacter sp. MPF02 TaxID=3388492 RepID=UPI0039851F4A